MNDEVRDDIVETARFCEWCTHQAQLYAAHGRFLRSRELLKFAEQESTRAFALACSA